MFKDTRHVLQKKPESELPVESDLFPVVTAEALLKPERRQLMLKSIESLCQLPALEYQVLYKRLVEQFAQFVQQLPQNKNSYYPYPGGLLDHGLERAVRALALTRNYFYDKEDQKKEMLDKNAMLRYAVFSVALLYDIGFIVTKIRVKLCNKDGMFLRFWHPYQGSMLNLASHYRYVYEKENWDYLRISVTPLLASQLMSLVSDLEKLKFFMTENSFSWLAKDKEVLETWFALFKEESRQPDSIFSIIPLADAQTIARYFGLERPFEAFCQPEMGFWDKYNELLLGAGLESVRQEAKWKAAQDKMHQEQMNQAEAETMEAALKLETLKETPLTEKSLETMSVEVSERKMAFVPATMAAGVAFMKWFLKAIQDKQIAIGRAESLLQRVNEGVFLDKALFEKFAQAQSQYKNPEVIQKQLANLGLHLNSVDGRSLLKYTGDRLGGVREGMVLSNPYLVFQTMPLPPVNTQLKLLGQVAAQGLSGQLPLDMKLSTQSQVSPPMNPSSKTRH